ncbi:unnamed protein product [Linum tenue]|uniref:Translation machinery-associated protein 22 n=1 Tax=Linum tenue TaxID=586396 RepID=A0AAV0MQ39_9ROSI|nr:unnamed protein product [Linum tenue]
MGLPHLFNLVKLLLSRAEASFFFPFFHFRLLCWLFRNALATLIAGETSASKPAEVKRLPGGKIKKKEKQEVVIEKIVRNKRKCITIIKGLDLFGIKLSDASKKLGKKFATGASVVKGPTDKEQIDVQGDIAYDVVEFITDTWPDVPESAITLR